MTNEKEKYFNEIDKFFQSIFMLLDQFEVVDSDSKRTKHEIFHNNKKIGMIQMGSTSLFGNFLDEFRKEFLINNTIITWPHSEEYFQIYFPFSGILKLARDPELNQTFMPKILVNKNDAKNNFSFHFTVTVDYYDKKISDFDFEWGNCPIIKESDKETPFLNMLSEFSDAFETKVEEIIIQHA